MSKFLPRICSVSTAEVDWLPSVNSWTGSRVRFSWGVGREERPQDEGIHWKSGLQAFLSWLPPPTHVPSLLPRCCHVAHAYSKEKNRGWLLKKLNKLSEKVDFGYGCPWSTTVYFIPFCGQWDGRWLRTAPDLLFQKESASLDVPPSRPKFSLRNA